MLFVVVGFRTGIIVLLSVILLNLRLNRVLLNRNLILGWRWQHPPPANLLRVRGIGRISLLHVLTLHSRRGHLRHPAYRDGYVIPKLIIRARDLAGHKPLIRKIRGRHLRILLLIKPEFDDSLFPSIGQLRHDQAWVLVRHHFQQA